MNLPDIGRLLIAGAVLLGLAGAVFLLLGRAGVNRLPGDFSFGGDNVRIFLPLGTSLLLSVIATIVLNLLWRR